MFSSYLIHISFIIIPSYFFSVRARKEEGRGGRLSEGGLENFIFTPGVELGIFPNPTEAYDWSEIPTGVYE